LILIETYNVITGIFDFQKVNWEQLKNIIITIYENQTAFNFILEILATKIGYM